MDKDLKLPETSFPQKADGYVREPIFNKKWLDIDIFNSLNKRNKNSDKKEYVLHDGPIFASGNIHVGHVLNKTLKDVIVRHKLMSGFPVDYKVGFDCHGLPIESKALKTSHKDMVVSELREVCEQFANEQVKSQQTLLKRMGLMGNIDSPYLTMSKEYETKQLSAFYELFNLGKISRKEKPIFYSPSTNTVLANAEVEYIDREDTSVYVKFQSTDYDFFFVAWTTMPWTLVGNKSLCLNSNLDYKVVEFNGDKLLVEKSVTKFGNDIVQEFKGSDLEKSKYKNLNGENCIVTNDDYVSSPNGQGTGVVHLCPGHGEDDFRVCTNYNIPSNVLVDNDGNYLENGLFCLSDGTEWVLEKLRNSNVLLDSEVITHSFPHDWRTKQPILFMLTKQFFLDLSDRKEMVKLSKNIDFSKNTNKNRFCSLLYDRESWCISRQRKWGFPLTVFYDKDENVILDKEIYEHLFSLFERYGSNCWFGMDTEDLLPKKYKGMGLTKCEDTLDVWLDSGLSWNNTLCKEADLYFEGSDQYGSWYQASMITKCLLQGEAPYKKVLTHGFVLDENGKKMSKSEGNVVDPYKYMKQYNTDVLRLWCVSVNYTEDVRIGDQTMKNLSKNYFKMRNTFRYMLSNLFDYNYDTNFENTDLSDKDLNMLNKLDLYKRKMDEAYTKFDFRNLFNLTNNFIANTSKQYFNLEMKELLYENGNSEDRVKAQYVFNQILNTMVKYLAPIVPYLCEDVYENMNKEYESVFFEEIK